MVSLAFPLSLLFLLTPFWVLFTTSMANLPSAADRENPEKATSAFSCIYCRKSFANHCSLGGHLRSHNVRLKSAWRRNCPGSFSASIGSASTIADPLCSNQPGNSCEVAGNNLAFRKRSSSNLTLPMNAASSGSGSTPSAGVPLDVSLSLGLNGVQKLCNDEIQTCQDGKPFFYGGVLQNSQPNLSLAVGRVSKMVGFLNFGEGERIYPVESLANTDVMRRSKRAKVISCLPVEIQKPQIKEPSLFKAMEKPVPALQISMDAEQKVPADLDLSLHL